MVSLLLLAAAGPGTKPDSKVEAFEAQLLHAPDADHADLLIGRLAIVRSEALSPTTRLLQRRAQRELAANKRRDALADASDAIALEPDQPVLWRDRAAIEAASGDTDAAVSDLGGALGRDPADLDSWVGLSQIAEKAGRNDQAVLAWQRVLLLCPAIRDGAARLRTLQRKQAGAPS